MEILEWIRFGLGGLFLFLGLLTFAIELTGVYRFHYVLNRMQIAATGDTLGMGSSLIGLMILSGWNFTSLKFFLVILFLWISSPVSSHLVARLEVTTNPNLAAHCLLPEELAKEKEGEAETLGDKLEEFVDLDRERKDGTI